MSCTWRREIYIFFFFFYLTSIDILRNAFLSSSNQRDGRVTKKNTSFIWREANLHNHTYITRDVIQASSSWEAFKNLKQLNHYSVRIYKSPKSNKKTVSFIFFSFIPHKKQNEKKKYKKNMKKEKKKYKWNVHSQK